MLTESFIASTSTPTALQKPASSSVAGAKDGSIFTIQFAPAPVKCSGVLKRSVAGPHSLAVSKTHVFSAQSGKAVVHVYGRDKMTHEATIALPDRITCIALVSDEDVLVMGTEGGSLLVWEIYTGRIITVPECHLQPVTCLAADPSGAFILSSSIDSNIHVWNLAQLRQFSSSSTSFSASSSSRHDSQINTLTAHKKSVLAVVIGHSISTAFPLAVSISADKTAVVWDFLRGIALRTYLLPTIPVALAIDPLDRGFYVSYDDGSIHLVSFHDPADLAADPSKILPTESVTAPSEVDPSEQSTGSTVRRQQVIIPSDDSRWILPSDTIGNSLSLALSWDGTKLLSGHASGVVGSWDIATGSFTALTTLPGPVSCLHDLSPTELLQSSSVSGAGPVSSPAIVKPRLDIVPDTSTKHAARNGNIPLNYTLNVQLQRPTLPPMGAVHDVEFQDSMWDEYLQHSASTGYQSITSSDFMDSSLAELATWCPPGPESRRQGQRDNTSTSDNQTSRSGLTRATNSTVTESASDTADFVSFADAESAAATGASLTPDAQIKLLKQKIAALEGREQVHLARIEELDEHCTAAVKAWHAASAGRRK